MLRRIRRLPSPALVISAIALVVAIGGGSYALAISSKQTKKIANKQIKKKAPGLSVKRADIADNAKNLGNKPPSGYLQKGNVRADGSAASAAIDNFTTTTFTNLVSKTFTAPRDGFIYLTGSISTEDDNSIAGPGLLVYRLTLDGTGLTTDPNAHEIATNSGVGVGAGSGSTTAVVPVTAGSHTVNLQAREGGTGDFIRGRELSSLFVPSGSAPTIPYKAKSKSNVK